MKKEYIVILFLCAIIVFQSLLYIGLIKSNKTLKIEFEHQKSEAASIISGLQSNINTLTQKNAQVAEELGLLKKQYTELQDNNTELKGSYDTLDTSYSQIKTEVEQTISKINNYETDLEESLAWFNTNSLPENIPNEKRIKNSLNGRCWEYDDDSCYVMLGCFYLINQKKLGLEYQYDTKTSGETDKLQSLSEFIHNWGGDCEDYSLFYKAEFNHVLNSCKERGGKNLTLEAWVTGTSDYFLDLESEWYLPNAIGIILPAGYIYPNVICGMLPSPNTGDVSGHCVIAFTNSLILNASDITLLDGAPMVEPQSGMYLGMINYNSGVTLSDYDSSIWTVITDNDLFQLKDGEWVGYAELKNELGEQKDKLIALS